MTKTIIKKIFTPLQKELILFLSIFILLLPNCVFGYLKNNLDFARLLHLFDHNGIDNSTTYLFAYLVTLIVYFYSKKWFKTSIYVLLIIQLFIRLFLAIQFKMYINISTIELLFDTNLNETKEFFTTYLFNLKTLICFISIVAISGGIILAEKRKEKIVSYITKSAIVTFAGVSFSCILLFCGMYNLNFYDKVVSGKSIDDVTGYLGTVGYPHSVRGHNTVMDLFVGIKLLTIDIEEEEKMVNLSNIIEHETPTPSTNQNDSLNIIIVIGESFVKWHSPLYGYNINTTPCLLQQKRSGNLFVFDNVTSPYNLTYKAEKQFFFCNRNTNNENWYDTPFFIQLFKKAGYYVGFFDNQNFGSGFTVETLNDHRELNHTIAKNSYSVIASNSCKYDGDFIEETNKYLSPKSKRNLYVYHLMGQHFPAKERYPDKFSKFSHEDVNRPDSYLNIDKKEHIAQYDNATYYNDYVIKRIIDNFRTTNSILIYFSDHGEENFDYRDYSGRGAVLKGKESEFCKYQFEVPFMIWTSDLYKTKNKEIIDSIEESTNRKMSLDLLPHLTLFLGEINTKYYHAQSNILSTSYKVGKRMVDDSNGNVWDYDKIVK